MRLACGVRVVHDLVTVNDRTGLVFDRVEGPWALDSPDGVAITARVHAAIHDVEAPTARSTSGRRTR